MKRKDIIVFTIVTLLIFLSGGYLTFNIYSNERLQDIILGDKNRNKVSVTETDRCTNKESIPTVGDSSLNQLKVLNDYQKICNSYITDTIMYFTGMQWINNPVTEANAMVTVLNEFKKHGIRPLIIMEPYLENSALLNWKSFEEIPPLTAVAQYFETIKNSGITDVDMGTLVPFPEPNVPNWGPQNGDGELFVKSVNLILGQYKKTFPTAKASILLNAQSYPADDYEWANGDYIPLTYYLTGLNPGLIDSLGIQGFPWVNSADSPRRRELYDASEFLAPDLAIAAMKTIRVRNLWFNTGSFGIKYANIEDKKITIPAADRKKIIASIYAVAEDLIQSGYRVGLNIFAADKINSRESTDWSYLKTAEYQVVFRDMIHEATSKDISVSLATL